MRLSSVVVLVLVVVACGCGGSSSSPRSQVESETHDYVQAGVLKMDAAGTTSDFLCTNVGDIRWRCLGQITLDGVRHDVEMETTCGDGGRCAHALIADRQVDG